MDLALVLCIIIYHGDCILKFVETIKLKHAQVLPKKTCGHMHLAPAIITITMLGCIHLYMVKVKPKNYIRTCACFNLIVSIFLIKYNHCDRWLYVALRPSPND